MKVEKKISLVGWGDEQVLLHTVNGEPGISAWRDGRLKSFAMTPWLKGLIAVVPPKAKYKHGPWAAPQDQVDLILGMRTSAVEDAVDALYTKDIHLLGEAIMTTYMAQQYMDAEQLPNLGEIAKRFSAGWGVYLFESPQHMQQELKAHSVLAIA